MRLTTSQLILAMTRVANGGTIVILQHKLDSWTPARIIYAFSKFSNVEIFKPEKKHSTRSSFYMVAKNVNNVSSEFKDTLERFQNDWYEATFGGKDGTGQCIDGENEYVSHIKIGFYTTFVD